MKIAFVMRPSPMGGTEKVNFFLIESFSSGGFDVQVLFTAKDAAAVAKLSENVGVSFMTMPEKGRAMPLSRLQSEMARFIREKQPDVIFSSLGVHNFLLPLAGGRVQSAPRFILVEHFMHGDSGALSKEQRDGIRLGYAGADRIVTVSNGMATHLEHTLAVPRKKIKVIRNPVLVNSGAAPTKRDSFVLAAGRLAPEKDFETLLRGFALLRKQKDLQLVILGDGPQEKYLKTLARTLGLSKAVNFLGRVDDTEAFMRKAALLVSTSRQESHSMVIAEALACGTPVVATNCPFGPKEILGGGRWGALVPVGNPARLASAMARVLERPPPSRALVQRSRLFDAESAFARYRRLAENLGPRHTS